MNHHFHDRRLFIINNILCLYRPRSNDINNNLNVVLAADRFASTVRLDVDKYGNDEIRLGYYHFTSQSRQTNKLLRMLGRLLLQHGENSVTSR